MNRSLILGVVVIPLLVGFAGCGSARASRQDAKMRQISVEEYVDKMKAGWIGQMAGVGWGGPT
ncbi:MAG: hypothetical protein KBI32_15340, partial [Phycisphaerae bacterium]|nr:hypothetical protein [Phycisphaerae bacterium]